MRTLIEIELNEYSEYLNIVALDLLKSYDMFIDNSSQLNHLSCNSMHYLTDICEPTMILGEYVTIRPTFGYRSRNDPGDWHRTVIKLKFSIVRLPAMGWHRYHLSYRWNKWHCVRFHRLSYHQDNIFVINLLDIFAIFSWNCNQAKDLNFFVYSDTCSFQFFYINRVLPEIT